MKWRCLLVLLAVVASAPVGPGATLELSGNWQVSLRDPHAAAGAAWRELALPGTLDDAGIGEPITLESGLTLPVLTRLQRKHSHVGPAWYRRDVTIPPEWTGRRVVLELERVLWESRVFVDGREVSRADSLSTPHRHELGALPPGRHELLLRIDNRELHRDVSHHILKYQVPENLPVAHAYTNHAQVMWNGVIGGLRLRADPSPEIAKLAVSPRLQPSPGVSVQISPGAAWPAGTKTGVKLVLRKRGETAVIAETRVTAAPGSAGGASVEWTLPTSAAVTPWDEFSPALYTLEATMDGSDGPSVSVDFGFREFAATGGELQLNGRRIFLRGNLECAIFPLTGYPPTDTEAWRALFGKAKSWGLNHFRFHSWCPPEAAFAAADELGFYLQVELPHWCERVEGHDDASWAFLQAEADRILSAYGNHPSFLLFSLGNELRGDLARRDALVRELRARDARRLYATTTFTFEKGHGRTPEPADEFFVTQQTADGWVRGQGIFNDVPPAFHADYREASAGIGVPLISHEIGQYAVYPDLREIARYTGNLVPLNFIAVRDDLAKKGLLELAPQFTAASGRFAAALYKEEIERALRTPQLDGFQLLQLQDFPGQGTALVGLLNAFWESKGVCTPETFREACAPLVPLVRLPGVTLERGETLRAPVEVANFLRELPAAEVSWRVRDAAGRTVEGGRFPPRALPLGNALACGTIELPIPAGGGAERWELEVTIAGTGAANRWSLWVYPKAETDVPAGVRLETTLAGAQRGLAAGERVLFAPPVATIKGIEGRFAPVFWSPLHFPKQPGTMGILCDPAHPALRAFPTDFHSDWQWWDPIRRSRSVVLDGLGVAPIVRVIDNFARNHSLGNLFEARVGPGRLLFCAIDITSDLDRRPAARQLRTSLLSYVASDAFAPTSGLSPVQLESLIVSADATTTAEAEPNRWEKKIGAYEAMDRTHPPQPGGVLFTGSSSIERWSSLAEDFPGLPMINRGMGGSHIAHAVEFFDRLVTPYRPAHVVLYAGTNDLSAGKPPGVVAADFRAFCQKLHAVLPEAKVTFISIALTPRRWPLREQIEQANAAIAAFCVADPRRSFLDVNTGMLTTEGALRPELFRADRLHLSPAGYAVWAKLLRPHLQAGPVAVVTP